MNIFGAIIEFLLANIAFVILFAGGIYSVVKRMNDTKNTASPASSRRINEHKRQTVSPFGVPAEARTDIPKELTVSVEKRPAISDKMNERYEMIKKEKTSHRYQDKEAAMIENTFKVDQEELKKAVIWSEILSKPKALQK